MVFIRAEAEGGLALPRHSFSAPRRSSSAFVAFASLW